MNRELIVNVNPTEISIALCEDKVLVELNKEQCQTGFSVGDIYLGKVRKIMPGLNAAFVNIGHEKDAFIHYLDLGSQFPSLQIMRFSPMISGFGITGVISSSPFSFEQATKKSDNPIIASVPKILFPNLILIFRKSIN
jgi:polyribonucleotide nucleotidyltransferase